jgi:hypothetical protein
MGHLQGVNNTVSDRFVSPNCSPRNSLIVFPCYFLTDFPCLGRLNQTEFSERIDPIITSHDGSREHLHNQLIAAIFGNVTREMPDQGLAPWVSANDKPSTGTGIKPVSGDATERRLKGEVMQLPSRDRRRIKDLVQNDVCDICLTRRLTWMHMLTRIRLV